MFLLVDVSALQNDRSRDPFGGAWGVVKALKCVRSALPPDGRWGFLLYSSTVREEGGRSAAQLGGSCVPDTPRPAPPAPTVLRRLVRTGGGARR